MQERESIYGVNLSDHITPVMVRDAIIECYYRADSEVLENLFQLSDFTSTQEKEDAKVKHVRIMIQKMFTDINEDFDNPTKESLVKVCDKCKEFAKHFRNKETIEKNYNEIMILIDRLE